MGKVPDFLEVAEKLRKHLAEAATEVARAMLLALADQYERMAHEAQINLARHLHLIPADPAI